MVEEINLVYAERTEFSRVLESYYQDNGQKDDLWEIRNLIRAQKTFGNWMYGVVPIEQIGNIVLPHYGLGGKEVVGVNGTTLKEASQHFIDNKELYKKENPLFVARIEALKKSVEEQDYVKAIYLSERPLMIGSSYEGLKDFEGRLTHLDGFHRLFVLQELGKNFTDSIEAYIATKSFNRSRFNQRK